MWASASVNTHLEALELAPVRALLAAAVPLDLEPWQRLKQIEVLRASPARHRFHFSSYVRPLDLHRHLHVHHGSVHYVRHFHVLLELRAFACRKNLISALVSTLVAATSKRAFALPCGKGGNMEPADIHPNDGREFEYRNRARLSSLCKEGSMSK